MTLVALFSWWYTAGWGRLAVRVGQRVEHVLDFFSVSTLMRTLFSPFRQISAGQVQGPLNAQMRAFGDRLFSRVFGAFIRGLFIIIGLVSALLTAILGLVQLLMWPLIPFFPLVGIALAVMGLTL
jgi:hypothetical protein